MHVPWFRYGPTLHHWIVWTCLNNDHKSVSQGSVERLTLTSLYLSTFNHQSSPFRINLLRVIPALTHYSDIVSDIPSGRIYGTSILTLYLTFFLAHTHSIWHSFWHSILHLFSHFIWHLFWHFFWHSIWHVLGTFWYAHSIRSWRERVRAQANPKPGTRGNQGSEV